MQLFMDRGDLETFRLYDVNAEGARERAEAFFASLAMPQFEVREYGESAGTNAGS